MNVYPMLQAVESIDNAIDETSNEEHRTKLKQAMHLVQHVLRSQGVFTGTRHALTEEQANKFDNLENELAEAKEALITAEFDLSIVKNQNSDHERDYLAVWKLIKNPNESVVDAVKRTVTELAEARDAHRRQQQNYIELHAAVLGEGCITSECHDIVAIAKSHREKAEKLRQALKSAVDILENDFDYRPDDEAGAGYQDIKKALLP